MAPLLLWSLTLWQTAQGSSFVLCACTASLLCVATRATLALHRAWIHAHMFPLTIGDTVHLWRIIRYSKAIFMPGGHCCEEVWFYIFAVLHLLGSASEFAQAGVWSSALTKMLTLHELSQLTRESRGELTWQHLWDRTTHMHGWQCLLRKRLGCDDLFSIFVVLVWLTDFPFKWPHETSAMLAVANEKKCFWNRCVSYYRLSFCGFSFCGTLHPLQKSDILISGSGFMSCACGCMHATS